MAMKTTTIAIKPSSGLCPSLHCFTHFEHCLAYDCQLFLRRPRALGASSLRLSPSLFFAVLLTALLAALLTCAAVSLTAAGTFSAAVESAELAVAVASEAVARASLSSASVPSASLCKLCCCCAAACKTQSKLCEQQRLLPSKRDCLMHLCLQLRSVSTVAAAQLPANSKQALCGEQPQLLLPAKM